MKIEKYWNYLIEKEAKMHREKMRQFGIEQFADNVRMPIIVKQNGVWGSQRYGLISDCFKRKTPFYIVAGFKSSSFHLAHLSLAKEIGWYAKRGGVLYLIGSIEERMLSQGSLSLNKNVESLKSDMKKFLVFFSKYSKIPLFTTKVIFDLEDKLFMSWAYKAALSLKIRKINRLFGWNEDNALANFLVAVSEAVAFLYPQLAENQPRSTLVLVDPLQAPYVELAEILAQKFKVFPPTALYHSIMPNLRGNGRMSSKKKEKTIFVDENREAIKTKLSGAVSGGRLERIQKKIGGDINKCIFFRIVSRLLSPAFAEKIYNSCLTGTNMCRECKLMTIPRILSELK